MELYQNVLLELEKAREVGIRGEELAQKYHVSRNAIWKSVRKLRALGYTIHSATNRGYWLDVTSDQLSEQGIRLFLAEPYQEMQLHIYEEVDSTNFEAQKIYTCDPKKRHLVVANSQRAGRGRKGRSFYSPASTGIYMTLCLPLQHGIEESVRYTTMAAVAVARSMEEITESMGDIAESKPMIKWVNDIYLQGRKVAGILTEAITSLETGRMEYVIVGIGINISTEDYPQEIINIATSLRPNGPVRNQLIARICNHMLTLMDSPGDYMEYYREHSLVLGQKIVYYLGDDQGNGYVREILEDGALQIEREDGSIEILRNGEISIVMQ